jgi:hypothetical protein
MIKLDFLASKINELLGYDKYCVYLNSNAFPDDIGDRNVVTMSVLRVPFGLSTEDLDAESMTLTLTFDLPCDAYGEDVIIRDGALAGIQAALLGHKKFDVAQPGSIYEVNSYLEQQPPSQPYIDSGRITQQIVFSGNILVQNINCGAVVGNDIKVFINGNQLLKISRATNTQIGADNNIPLSEDITTPEMHAISCATTKTITFLYTGRDIEKKFLKIAEGVPPFDINQEYTYKVVYPAAFESELKFKILGVAVEESVGVWLKYSLSMQIVSDSATIPPPINPDDGEGEGGDTGSGGGDTGGEGDGNEGEGGNTGGNEGSGGDSGDSGNGGDTGGEGGGAEVKPEGGGSTGGGGSDSDEPVYDEDLVPEIDTSEYIDVGIGQTTVENFDDDSWLNKAKVISFRAPGTGNYKIEVKPAEDAVLWGVSMSGNIGTRLGNSVTVESDTAGSTHLFAVRFTGNVADAPVAKIVIEKVEG